MERSVEPFVGDVISGIHRFLSQVQRLHRGMVDVADRPGVQILRHFVFLHKFLNFREIELASYEPDQPKAQVAIEIFTKTIAEFIAKYAVSLKGLDAIVFTGGIGENQINIRKKICEDLEWMGVKIDLDKNNVRSEQVEISSADAKIRTFIIPTNEELVIARDTKALVEGK